MLALSLVFAITLSILNPMQAEAKIKKKKLTPYNFAISKIFEADSVATELKKGTYKLVIKDKNNIRTRGCIKFTAPKTKNYTFTLSNLKASNNKYLNGYMEIRKPNYQTDTLNMFELKTNNNRGYQNMHIATQKGSTDFVTKRYAKFRLQKNETVYVYFELGGNFCNSMSFKFSIK